MFLANFFLSAGLEAMASNTLGSLGGPTVMITLTPASLAACLNFSYALT